jgi:LacI family transcriptional regulator
LEEKISRAHIAKMAGVAESTVSRALNDSPQISQVVKDRVRDIAERMGYIPNRQAVLLARSKTCRIGLVVRTYKSFSPFSRSYFPRLLDGVLMTAEEHGYSITIVLDKAAQVYKDLSLLVRAKEVDGLLFSVTPCKDPRLTELNKKGVPFVLINNMKKGYFCVNCDPEQGMRDAFYHLTALGHKHIAYVHGDTAYWDGITRLRMFKKLAKEHDIRSLITPGNFSRTSGYEAAKEILSLPHRPTLIMCASDRCAIGVMAYCREQGVEIPGEISLIGFDNLGPARDSQPGLTTVHNPVSKLGSEATAMLIDRLEGREVLPHHLIESGFIVRQSTGRPFSPSPGE